MSVAAGGLRRAGAAAGAILLPAAPALAQGCALCRENLSQGGGQGLQKGFLCSILLLVSLPVLMAGGFLYLLRRAARKARTGGEGDGTGGRT